MSCDSGPNAMATDELLLELAEKEICSLRFYTWTEPTVSLGYFQSSSLITNSETLKVLPWVRRTTGGEALVHHHELTYALGMPLKIAGHKSTVWQEKIHLVIREALSNLGVIQSEINLPEQRNDPGKLLCFHHHAPQDLTINRNKILGSAQRKRKTGIIQHGGILLAQSKYTPSLPGILELTGIRLDAEILRLEIIKVWGHSLDWVFNESDWTREEKERIMVLENARFGNAVWNTKR